MAVSKDLSPEYALLGLVAQRPAHGYELHQRLTNELGFVWRISQSQTYAALSRLEHKGDIASSEVHPEKLPARYLYRISAAGKTRFNTWLFTPSAPSPRAINLEFTTRLYFAALSHPPEVLALIEAQQNVVRERALGLRRSMEKLGADETFHRLALSLRIGQLESILGWLDGCATVFH
ncbi:MAG: PadR family transcriptional regulator [Bifidobacterium adolescentis]